MLSTTEERRPALTQRQQEIYEFLKDKILNRGYGPTVREIGNHFGIRSPNGVMCHLKALEKKGLITRESHRSRAIQLAEAPEHRLTLRLAGDVSGDGPLRSALPDERVDFASLFDSEGNCCVRATGHAFQSHGIMNADHVVVNRNQTPSERDLVLVSSGSIVTFIADSQRKPEAEVLGVVVGVIRRVG